MDTQQKASTELMKFRKLMNCSLSKEKAQYIWGKNFLKNSSEKFIKEETNRYTEEKINILKDNLKYLKVFNWVKFIGISGSVAAGFTRERDDIDLFIVVKDGCAWLYRGILTILNLFHNKIRAKRHGKDVKNKFCINLICEESGLVFDSDMFNFHELMYLIPVYNEKYLNYIYSQNAWLKTEYLVKNDLLITRISKGRGSIVLIRLLNYIAFLLQLLFMILSKHSPEIDRLKSNFKKGKIEFFLEDYKKEKMEEYLK